MVVTGPAAKPEGAFTEQCTAGAKQEAAEGGFWMEPFHRVVWAPSMQPLKTLPCLCPPVRALSSVPFTATARLRGWIKAGTPGVTWCFTLGSTREPLQAKDRVSGLCHAPREQEGQRWGSGAEVSSTNCLVLAFPWSCNKSLSRIKTIGLFADLAVKSPLFCLLWSRFLPQHSLLPPSMLSPYRLGHQTPWPQSSRAVWVPLLRVT